MTWTRFTDMLSGGDEKTEWAAIFIEAEEEKARSIFWDFFKLDPDHVSCSCCGTDFGVSEVDEEDVESGDHVRTITEKEWRKDEQRANVQD